MTRHASAAAHPAAHHSGNRAFIAVHALLVPGMLALAAIASHTTGVDDRVAAWFFDPIAGIFPARNSHTLELIGHHLAKSAVWAVWLVLLGLALAAPRLPRLAGHRRLLWTTVAAMALGPAVVVALKELNAIHCPWNLERFGGWAQASTRWFVSRAEVAHCFPGGHAAGGFALVALFFAGRVARVRWLQWGGLAAALGMGGTLSLVRMATGAHFLSHNLWSAAIDWWAAALLFLPLLRLRRG